MKKTRSFGVWVMGTVVSNLLITVFIAPTVLAAEISKKPSIYDKKKVKSRAQRGYSNNGKEIYSYTTVNSWDDSLASLKTEDGDADLLGNVEVKDGVRKVHNVTIVKDSVNSNLKEVQIGNVDVENDTDDIVNFVEIEGDLNPQHDAKIGVVTLKSGEAKNINSTVKVGTEVDVTSNVSIGSITSKGERITIGGVQLEGGKAMNVVSTVSIGVNDEKN